jgi:hypothetical protein
MLKMILLYGACAFTGWSIQRRLLLNSLLQRGLIVFMGASAQLCLSIQLLSLFDGLTPNLLLLLNLGFSLIGACAAGVLRPAPPARLPSSYLWGNLWTELRQNLRPFSATTFLLCIGILAFSAYSLTSVLLIERPLTDIYHFEMPAYWIQHKSIDPFPTNNPRIVGLALFTETLAVPAMMYARTALIFPVLGAVFVLLCLGIIYSLARKIGCSASSALGAAALCLGCCPFEVALIYTGTEGLFAAMLSGAAALWFLESVPLPNEARPRELPMILGALAFGLACGVKNTMLLIAPVFLLALAWLYKRALLKPRVTSLFVAAGVAGCLASGMLWNMANNYKWFGSPAGSPLLKGTLSHEFAPRSVWTRVVRGSTLFAFDTLWVPRGLRATYAEICAKTAIYLGGKPVLDEDDEYYSFERKYLTPQKGFGVLGLGFWVPAMVAAVVLLVQRRRSREESMAIRTLLLLSIGSFVACHVILRWQSISLVRLIPPFLILSAPLCALLLEGRLPKLWASGLLIMSVSVFTILGLGLAARRFDWRGNALIARVRALQNPHDLAVSCTGPDGATYVYRMREDFTKRELYQLAMKGIPQPATFGFLGWMNAENYFMFGDKFQNEVISLVDCREPTVILPVPSRIEFLFWDEFEPVSEDWFHAQHFVLIFQAKTEDGKPLLKVFKRGTAEQSVPK